ncbi:MAG: ribbon-helix-helix protein, CopG family [Nitrospinae bacterium]|nr:ribbon-helix-helix protein, CopG family [Nitrospinota bacterium]
MLSVRLDEKTEKRLDKLAEKTGRSKSYYVRKAVQQFLEDREDYLAALAALERGEPVTSIAELRKELGLER